MVVTTVLSTVLVVILCIAFVMYWIERDFDMPAEPKEPEAKNPCQRCRTGNLDAANFCRSCGLMLKSHATVELWLTDQRDMLRARNRLSTVEAPNGH